MNDKEIFDTETGLEVVLTRAMRGLAKSVVLISTVNKAQERRVMVATAVTPMSMNPPSMLICINRDASSYTALLEGADFCINLLRSNQEGLARFCATSSNGEPRFQMGSWVSDERGTPYLLDAQAAVVCAQDARFSYGSHDIFVGRVREVHNDEIIDPLVYVDGSYRRMERLELSDVRSDRRTQ